MRRRERKLECVRVLHLHQISGKYRRPLKRRKEGFWCHVTGNIEADETACQAVIRELREETGVVTGEIYTAGYLDHFYEPDRNRINIVPVFVVFIPSNTEVQLNEEHTDYKWCTLEEAKSLVPFPNMRSVYDFVWSNFVIMSHLVEMKVKVS